MKPIGYGIQYMLRHHVLRQRVPLICGLVLTNKCNLRCRHCKIPSRGDRPMPFDEVQAVMDSFYQRGGRCVYLEGGEPFLWRDAQHGIEHVVEYAHQVGYSTVIIYTNGTLPLETSADTVFVSIDGLRATHDSLRGTSFDRIMKNVQDSSHASLFVNFTINCAQQDPNWKSSARLWSVCRSSKARFSTFTRRTMVTTTCTSSRRNAR